MIVRARAWADAAAPGPDSVPGHTNVDPEDNRPIDSVCLKEDADVGRTVPCRSLAIPASRRKQKQIDHNYSGSDSEHDQALTSKS